MNDQLYLDLIKSMLSDAEVKKTIPEEAIKKLLEALSSESLPSSESLVSILDGVPQ